MIIYSVNPLYLIFDKVDRYIEENDKNKVLMIPIKTKK